METGCGDGDDDDDDDDDIFKSYISFCQKEGEAVEERADLTAGTTASTLHPCT